MLTKHKLRELIDVTRGMSLPGEYYSESGEYIRLTMGNFNYNGGGFKENTSKTDIYYTGPIREEYILNKGDIITPLTEQALGLLGTTAMIPESGKYIQSQDVALITCKEDKIDHLYCYYLISSDLVKKQLSAVAQQTKIRHTSPDKIMDCTVWIPEMGIQQRIGKTLYEIDQKISLSTRMNAELEAMAKQLYDYWFVQFDFPDENGNPYKSSGGEMVYNSTLKREIPAGWEVKNLNKIADSFRGVTYNKSDLVSESEDSILVLRGNNIPSSGQFAYDSNVAFIPRAMISEEQKINKGDIIITMSSGSKEHIGKCFMFQSDSDHTFGAFLSKFVPSNDRRYYVYLSMLSDFFKAFVKTTCNGTGINNLTNDTFNNVLFPIPNSKTLREFEDITESIYKKVGVNQKQINDLTHLRDSILPMLMNGQVTVE